IGDVYNSAFKCDPPRYGSAIGPDREPAYDRVVLRRCSESSKYAIDFTLADRDQPIVGLAQPRSSLDQSVEHRLEIESRATDDLENVARRGLVFERLLQIAGAGLQLIEQPSILHRDHRLVGKGAHQFDLPLAKWLDPLPRETNRAEHGPLAQQRHSKA